MEDIYTWTNGHEAFTNALSTIIVGLFGIGITIYFARHSKKLSEDQIFHQLFRDFNTRYDKINGDLQELELQQNENVKYSLDDLDKNHQLLGSAMDFLNLCAEEY